MLCNFQLVTDIFLNNDFYSLGIIIFTDININKDKILKILKYKLYDNYKLNILDKNKENNYKIFLINNLDENNNFNNLFKNIKEEFNKNKYPEIIKVENNNNIKYTVNGPFTIIIK